VLPITEAISERAVQLIEDYFLSHSLKLADALIAATALERNLTLATANTKHYRVIQGLALEAFKLE
jgi:predicted nucleic acid-binding protein